MDDDAIDSTCDIHQLPLPRAGRIDALIHIADLHIRSGSRDTCRFEDYTAVFTNLIESVAQHPAVQDGRAAAVVAGDVFHNKDTIQTSGAMLFGKLLDELSRLMPVYLLPGNHDYRSSTQHDEDLVSTFCTIAARPNVLCLTKTGLYRAGRIGFGLLDIRDVRVQGADSGTVPVSMRAAFPDPRRLRQLEDVDVIAALFHGPVSDARLPGGHECAEVSECLDGDQAFAGYDIALLGDIHAQQMGGGAVPEANVPVSPTCCAVPVFQGSFGGITTRAKAKTVWAYPGSCVQQTFGEAVIGHGYILWDLTTETATAFHVPGAKGMLTAHRRSDGTWMLHRVLHGLGGLEHTPLDEAVRMPGFPHEAMVRVQGGDVEDARDLVKALEERGVMVVHARFCAAIPDPPSALGGSGTAHDAGCVANNNHHLEWVPYIKSRAGKEAALTGTEWERWLQTDPAALVVPTDQLQDLRLTELSAAVVQRNLVIEKKAMQAQDVIRQMNGSNRRIPFLLKMAWSNLLCYGEDNTFDFTRYRGQIVTLSAPNSGGKTTFAETICWALYGEGFPSRKAVVNPNNLRRARGAKNACTSITFRLGNRTYQLQRTFQSGDKRAVKQRDIVLQELDDAGRVLAKGEQRSGASNVKQWINDDMASLPQYLATVMLTQTNEVEFFRLKPAEQTDFLVKALGLDAVHSLIDVFREAALAHENLCKHLRTAESTLELAVGPAPTAADLHNADHAAGAVQACLARRDALQADLQRLQLAWSGRGLSLEDVQAACDQEPDLAEQQLAQAIAEAKRLSVAELDAEAHQVAQDWSALLRLQLAGDVCLEDIVDETQGEEDDALPTTNVQQPDMSRAECERVLAAHQAWQERFQNVVDRTPATCDACTAETAFAAAREACDEALSAWEAHFASRPADASATAQDEAAWKAQMAEAHAEGLKLIPRTRRASTDLQQWAAECENNVRLAQKLEGQLDNARARLADAEHFLKAYEAADHPYNPDCDACRAQTHRLEYERQVSVHRDLTATCERLVQRIAKGGSSERWQERATAARTIASTQAQLEARTSYYQEQKRLRESAASWRAALQVLEGSKRAAQEAHDAAEVALERARFTEEATHRLALAQNARDQLALNDAYERLCSHKQRQERLRMNLTLEELVRQLDAHADFQRAATHAQRLSDLRDACIAYADFANTQQDLADAEAALQDAVKDLGAAECAAGYDAAAASHRDALRQTLETLRRRTESIQCIERLLRAFAQDCAGLAVNLVAHEANRVLQWAGQPETRLVPRWTGDDGNSSLAWYVEDQRGTAVRVEAQGGFVRFIAGLAVRVAVARSGVNAIGQQQLIVDEGFTAADTENLSLVPQFLQGLLKRYTTIIQMSHLATVRDAAHVQVSIDKDAHGNSALTA